MPASQDEVVTAFQGVQDLEHVFAIVKISGTPYKTFWSEPGGKPHSHSHAEYFLAEDLRHYDVEEGEIVEIDITLKWSPCGDCAMQLATLLQELRGKPHANKLTMTVYYLAIYRGKAKSGLDPWEVLSTYGIPCKAYKNSVGGGWWPSSWHHYQGYY